LARFFAQTNEWVLKTQHLLNFESVIEKRTEARIIKLLEARCLWLVHHDRLTEADELRLQVALIKGEK